MVVDVGEGTVVRVSTVRCYIDVVVVASGSISPKMNPDDRILFSTALAL